ncbi:hypothetical protein ACA910_007383 [Epithemia clementina (nom. ined.)]
MVVGPRSTIFHSVPPSQAPDHVLVQTTKLATALVTGIYSQPTDKDDDDQHHQQDVPLLSLASRMFKQVIHRNHVDFFYRTTTRCGTIFAILFGTIGSRRTSAQGKFQ